MTKERLPSWLGVGAALVAGLLLRLWFFHHMARIAGDTFIYGGIARNWLQHGIYGFVGQTGPTGVITIRPTLIRLPGYPIFIAACFRLFGMANYRAVILAQIAADLVACCLAAALAARLFGSRAALAVLWLAVLCPFTACYVAAPLTETLVLATIALAFYAFARWQDNGAGNDRWLWLIAATLAYSILLRPDQGLLAAAVLPAMLWRSLATRDPRNSFFRRALPILAAALCVLLPLVPWTIRNWSTFHVFQPLAPRYANDPGELPPLGFARWYRTWAIEFASTDQVYWNYNGDVIRLTNLPQRAFDMGSPSDSQALRDRTAALLADYNLTTTITPALDARFGALAAERIHAHPFLYYVALPMARLLNMLLRPRVEMMQIPDQWWRWPARPGQTAFAAAYAGLNLVYIVLGVAGFYRWKQRGWNGFRELAFAMAGSVILRCLLLVTIDNSEPRYTLEFFPVLFVWAGALFAALPPSHSQVPNGG